MSLIQLSIYYFWSNFVVSNQVLVACMGTPVLQALKLLSVMCISH